MELVSYLETLPNEIILQIIDTLSPSDLLLLFNTSYYLRNIFYPEYKYKMENEIINKLYPEQLQELSRKIEKEIKYISSPSLNVIISLDRPCLLSFKLTTAMGLNPTYSLNGNGIYTFSLLTLWWIIYVRTHKLLDRIKKLIYPDSFMKNTFGNNINTLTIEQLNDQLKQHIQCNIRIQTNPEIKTYLYREKQDLEQILNLIRANQNM